MKVSRMSSEESKEYWRKLFAENPQIKERMIVDAEGLVFVHTANSKDIRERYNIK